MVTFELQDRREQWVRVVARRDVDAYAELVAEDVVWFPPGQLPVIGRSAFADWVRPFFESFEYQFSIEPIAIVEAETSACERSRFRSTLRPAGGGDDSEMQHEGTCVIFWRLDPDGAWRIERYVDESELR
jgi:uncharacterized protein (TIGR02246 family)